MKKKITSACIFFLCLLMWFTSLPLWCGLGTSVLTMPWLLSWGTEGTIPCAYFLVISTKPSRSTNCVAEGHKTVSYSGEYILSARSLSPSVGLLTLVADHALQYFLGLAWRWARNSTCSATYWWEMTTALWVRCKNLPRGMQCNVILFTTAAANTEITKSNTWYF